MEIKDITKYSTYLILYLALCGGLYHIAFWNTFNINGIEYVSLTNLFKSSVKSILHTSLLIIISIILSEQFSSEDVLWKRLIKILKTAIPLSIILFVLAFLYSWESHNYALWLFWAGLLALLTNLIFIKFNELTNIVKKKVIIKSLILLPIIAFSIGKYESILIHKNINFLYINDKKILKKFEIEKIPDTIKFIDYTDEKIIFTDINNSSIYIINNEAFDFLKFKSNKIINEKE